MALIFQSTINQEFLKVQIWEDVNIQDECSEDSKSLHQYMLNKMPRIKESDFIMYDHGSGEIADVITANELEKSIELTLYHVKASDEANPGARSSEVYELSCQAIKSTMHLLSSDILQNMINRRLTLDKNKIKKNTINFLDLLASKSKPLKIHMSLIQPGLSKKKINNKILSILYCCDNFVTKGNIESMEILCSE